LRIRYIRMLSRLKAWWCKYNPFDISEVIERMVCKFDDVEVKLTKLQKSLEQEVAFYKAELEMHRHVINQIGDSLPDMLWFKDLDGRYVYANTAIKGGLLFSEHPMGKTDIELAQRAKLRFGEANHTFGEKCANSDSIVLQEQRPMRFLESGKIQGKIVYLEVYKNVVRDPMGNVIGVCGTGRDLTEYVEAVKSMEGNCAKRCGEAEVVLAFKKYEFRED